MKTFIRVLHAKDQWQKDDHLVHWFQPTIRTTIYNETSRSDYFGGVCGKTIYGWITRSYDYTEVTCETCASELAAYLLRQEDLTVEEIRKMMAHLKESNQVAEISVQDVYVDQDDPSVVHTIVQLQLPAAVECVTLQAEIGGEATKEEVAEAFGKEIELLKARR